ncbi:MAG: SDR family oxidoreductase [Alphaproteobacteria bacterium]|nr:SDR family oxidoreductase [Alphaproteobacteria bacterium]
MTGAHYPDLAGRVALVTGGASGIGAALVARLHAQGCAVAFVDLDAAAGEALANRLGERVWFRACDVTDAGDLERAIGEAAAALGAITLLINNVAHDARREAARLDAAQWRADLAVNLDPVFLAARTVYPGMKAAGGGAIVNLASINALIGPAGMASYVAAKGAILALTKSLAREWGPDGVRVNAISPGWVVTERQLALWLTPEAEAEWARQTALAGRILPDDIADAVLFLASGAARRITGQNLVVDGGRT